MVRFCFNLHSCLLIVSQVANDIQRCEPILLWLTNSYLCSLENMIARFEEPSSMVRWDSPLFTITWTDDELPMDRIWDAVTHGNVKPPNAGTQAVGGVPV